VAARTGNVAGLVPAPTPDKADPVVAADPPVEPSDEATAGETGDQRPTPSRRTLTLIAVPLIVLVIMNNLGGWLWAGLADTHPAVLLALNASNRHLIATTNYLDAWTYYGIGGARLLVSDPLFFLLGYWYGDAAVTWMEKRTHTWGDLLRSIERFFGKASYPLVFLMPNNYICLFAGAAKMPIRAFVAVNVAGTVARLYVFRRFGEAFQEPIDDVLGWVGDHRVPLLVASVAIGLVSVAFEAKRGETEVGALANLDDELLDAGDDGDDRQP
jgi:membrane protein DedA with SNARE-associated domain